MIKDKKNLESKILELGHAKTYKKDEFLFHVDDPAEGFYYLQSGEVRVFKMDEQGKEVEVIRPHPGDFFGEAIIFVQERFPSYAQAVKDSQLIFFEKKSFFQRLERDPAIGKFFLNLLAKKCIVLNKRIEALELRTVRQRLAQYILSSCRSDAECVVTLPMKKSELAKLLGTISETLSRNLKQLQEDKIIAVEGNKILVMDKSRLSEELGAIS